MAKKQPQVAVIGCGYWGKNLVRNFAELGALAAVADSSQENAETQAKIHNVPVRSIEDILADTSIAGIVIATPPPSHFDTATAALNAGKHVYVEKPIAVTLQEAEALEKLAAKKSRALMVGHLLQYHPAYVTLRAMVDRGEFGKLMHIYSNRLNLGKLRTEENAMWNLGPHDVSMILGLMNDELPIEVQAQGANMLTSHNADVVTAQFSFQSGAKAHVFVSWLHPDKEQRLVVVGEKLMAVFDDGEPWESKLRLYRHRIEWKGNVPMPHKAEAEAVKLEPAEPLKNECQHFLNACMGEEVLTDGAEGIRVLRVLDATEVALKTNRPVRLDLRQDVQVHETAAVGAGAQIGKGTKIWHFSHVMTGAKIGENCVIGQNVMIGSEVVVGNRCKIQNNVSLYKGVVLEDGVFCGPSCVFTNVNTPRAEIERKNEFLATNVGRAATIGANATIICGNDLGAYCLIGAGAVVTKDVKPHALMVGNPAKQMGWVSHAGERLGDDLVCPREGRKYRIEKDQLVEIAEEKKNARVA